MGGGSTPATITSDSFTFQSGAVLVLGIQSLANFNASWGTSLTASQYIQVASLPGFNNSADSGQIFNASNVLQASVNYSSTPNSLLLVGVGMLLLLQGLRRKSNRIAP